MENKEINLQDYDKQIERLLVERNLAFEQMRSSKDPYEIIKAEEYYRSVSKNSSTPSAYIFPPNFEFYTGSGYKQTVKTLTFDVMRRMSKVPQIWSVISTRIEQVLNFSSFQNDVQREGWTIRKKLSRFDDYREYKLNDKDKRRIDELATFLEEGGKDTKWNLDADDIDDFIRMVTKDSLELDQLSFELYDNRRMDLVGFKAIDASTIRLLDTIDRDSQDHRDYDEKFGYKPVFAQVWHGEIICRFEDPIVWYPWELGWGIRNRSTDVLTNGYGTSELEILVEIITWMLWGMQYNGNFFKNGSAPKGFWTFEGNVDKGVLSEFRQAMRQMMMGVQNAHKVPVLGGGDTKVNWVSMQESNKDMEFQLWNEFLTTLACAVYKIDPSELGFNFKGGSSQLFGQDGQKERLSHSRDKGLKPVLRMLQKVINKYIIQRIDPNYEFAFTGIDLEDETQIIDNDIKKLNGGLLSLQDAFRKHNFRELNQKKDIILNPQFLNYLAQQQFGGMGSNEAVDEMTGEESGNPFEQMEKGSDPIMDNVMNYLQKSLSESKV